VTKGRFKRALQLVNDDRLLLDAMQMALLGILKPAYLVLVSERISHFKERGRRKRDEGKAKAIEPGCGLNPVTTNLDI
jgi:hypothetical protein